MHLKETQQLKSFVWKVMRTPENTHWWKIVDFYNDTIVNGIGDHGIKMLCDMLKENTTLVCLHLDGKNWNPQLNNDCELNQMHSGKGNNFGNSAATTLAEVLQKNTTLKELGMNGLGDSSNKNTNNEKQMTFE